MYFLTPLTLTHKGEWSPVHTVVHDVLHWPTAHKLYPTLKIQQDVDYENKIFIDWGMELCKWLCRNLQVM